MHDPLDEISAILRPRLPSPPRPVFITGHVNAAFVDVIALVCPAALGGVLFAIVSEAFPLTSPARPAVAGLAPILLTLLFTAGDVLFAASAGKWLLGLTIRTASAQPARRRRLVVRWLVKYAPLLLVALHVAARQIVGQFMPDVLYSPSFHKVLQVIEAAVVSTGFLVVVGSLFALLPSRRTLHDWIAGTAVFDAVSLAATPEPARRGFEVAPLAAQPVPPVAASPDPSSDSLR